MDSSIASPAGAGPETEARPAAGGSGHRASPWLVAVALAAIIGAVAGGLLVHARDQRQAAVTGTGPRC
jgi:hypothetical protein